MKISELAVKPLWNTKTSLYDNEISDDIIEKVLFSGIEDDNTICTYAIIFGVNRIIEFKARLNTMYELYKSKRVKKLILAGSNKGISSKKRNQTPKSVIESCSDISTLFNDDMTEAERMKNYAISLGIKEEDLIIDSSANNSVETLMHVKELIDLDKEESLILVTSGYHMRRCICGALKYISKDIHYCPVVAATGYFEKDNYTNTELGRLLASFDANRVISQVREGIISDMELDDKRFSIK